MPRSLVDTIYVDACAFLWYFNKPVATHSITIQEAQDRQLRMELLFYYAEAKKLRVVTSVYTKIELSYTNEEVRIGKLKPEVPQLIDAVLDNNRVVRLISVSPTVTERAREVVRKTKFASGAIIKPKDAIHVASAIVYKADKLYTYDGGMLKWSGKAEVNGLTICQPDIELPLFRRGG